MIAPLSSTGHTAAAPAQAPRTVAITLDQDAFQQLLLALTRAGIDPGALGLPRQETGTSQNPGTTVQTPFGTATVPDGPRPNTTPAGTPPPSASPRPDPAPNGDGTSQVVTPFGTATVPDGPRPTATPFGTPGDAPTGLTPNPRTPQTSEPPADAFQPKFEDAEVQSIFGERQALNRNYFATRETAQWIADKYGDGSVYETPYQGQGGPFWSNQRELHVRLGDGRMVNAGVLAAYYERNPPHLFPGVADRLIRNLIEG